MKICYFNEIELRIQLLTKRVKHHPSFKNNSIVLFIQPDTHYFQNKKQRGNTP